MSDLETWKVAIMDDCISKLFVSLEERGYQGRIVPIHHLSELKTEILGRFREGLFDEELYRLRLSFYDFTVPKSLPDAKSIIVVSVPRPQAQATFTFRGEKKALILPPTYVAWQRTIDHVSEVLTQILEPEGYKLAGTLLPLKILAVRSGLAEYGLNNITYTPGMGSFHQLTAFYSDLPCVEDTWREAQVMKICKKCQACMRSCPTHAISSDRFLLHGERCITYRNEMKGDVPFPSWIDPSWHNCLYGCFHCQRVCPVDKPFANWVEEKEEFSQEETEQLLSGQLNSQLSSVTLDKLKNLDLADPDSPGTLSRNLQVFFGPTSVAKAWRPPV